MLKHKLSLLIANQKWMQRGGYSGSGERATLLAQLLEETLSQRPRARLLAALEVAVAVQIVRFLAAIG